MEKLKAFLNIPPNKFIEEELDVREWSADKFAEILGITKKEADLVISNKQRIKESTAKLLSKIFGQSDKYWTNLYYKYYLRENR